MPAPPCARNTPAVIPNVLLHLLNDLPVVADLEDLPAGGDRNIRCTNVRTVDGKRPPWVHDRNSTFVFPMSMIRLIEAPAASSASANEIAEDFDTHESMPALLVPAANDEELDEDLLARMRSV